MKQIAILLAALMVCLSPVAVMALATPDVVPPVAPVAQVCPTGWLTMNEVADYIKSTNGTTKPVDIVDAKDFDTTKTYGGQSFDNFIALVNSTGPSIKVDDIKRYFILDVQGVAEFAVPVSKDDCLLDHFGLVVKALPDNNIGASLK